MSIMPCYLDERAVENELGGKWELLYEYTFDESHAEGFEFPHDLDGTPFNLNGVFVVIENSVATQMNYSVNDIEFIDVNFAFSGNQKVEFISKINNGFHNFEYLQRHEPNGSTSVGINTYPRSRFFAENITSFKLAYTGAKDSKLKIYVLRGV